jgi:hypothetical protein
LCGFLEAGRYGGCGDVSVTPSLASTAAVGGAGNVLSTKAKTEIGVGLAIFIVLLLSTTATLCVWSRRRKRRAMAQAVENEKAPKDTEFVEAKRISVVEDYIEIDGEERKESDGYPMVIGELGSPIKAELVGNDVPEFDGENVFEVVHELEGSSHEEGKHGMIVGKEKVDLIEEKKDM